MKTISPLTQNNPPNRGRWVFGMLGRRHGTPGWAYDPVVEMTEAGKRQQRGRMDIGQQEERVGQFQ